MTHALKVQVLQPSRCVKRSLFRLVLRLSTVYYLIGLHAIHMKDALLLLLQKFADVRDEADSTFPSQLVTLHMGGLLITGELISERSYMQQFIGGTVQKVIDQAIADGKLQPPDKDANPEYIHLQAARFFTPGQQPIPTSGVGALWRGRFDAVDGFILGELRVGSR